VLTIVTIQTIFPPLLSADESEAYAHSAYASSKHSEYFKDKKIDKPLTKEDKEDKEFNRLLADVRCTVERVFGVLKYYAMSKAG
jgi:hypothetical protein